MLKPFLLCLLTVGVINLSFAPSRSHLQVVGTHLAAGVTTKPSFEGQFATIENDFKDIDKQITTENKTKYGELSSKLAKYNSTIKDLSKILKEEKVEVVLNAEQCPPKGTNISKIKKAVYQVDVAAQDAQSYVNSCKDCAFAKSSLEKIEKFTKDYDSYVNRTVDGGFCTTAPVATSNTPPPSTTKTTTNTTVVNSTQTQSNTTAQTQNKTNSVAPVQSSAKNTTNTSKPVENKTATPKPVEKNNSTANTTTNKTEKKVIAVAPVNQTKKVNKTEQKPVTVTQIKCSKDEVYNKTQSKCVPINRFCQPGFAFVEKLKRCIAYEKLCTPDQYFDQQHHSCYAKSLKCKDDEHYDRKQHVCVKMNTSCSEDQRFSMKLQACVKKVICKEGEVLDPEFQMCQRKKVVCPKNQIFDYQKKQCITHKYITSPYYQKLIYVGKFTKYVEYYNTAKTTDKSLMDCPFDSPFYQKSTESCITCPEKTPYFDLTQDKCVKCNFNEFFSPYKHKCVNERKSYSYPQSVRRMRL